MATRRILLLITDLEIGGTPTVVRELGTRLHEPDRGVHVEVSCLAPMGPVGREIERAGVRVTPLEARGPGEIVGVVGALADLIESRRIDTVFSFLIHANAVAAAASCIVHERIRFIQSIQTTQPTPRWHWRLQGLIHLRAEAIVVPSESIVDAAVAWAGVPRGKLVVIPNAIDPQRFKLDRVPAPEGTFRIGFIGRLDPVKRVPDLVEAMSRLDAGARLDVYGQGPERRAIEDAARLFGMIDRIQLHGAIARPQEALARMDVLVLPSQAEGFGLVLIEAMAAGVPVVATDVPGIRNVVGHGKTGLLVPAGSPGALADAIATVRDDAALRAQLVTAARADVMERFTWGAVIERYRTVLGVS